VDLHPNLNDPIALRDQADREYASTVENLGVGLVVVAKPDALPADETFGAGTEVSIVWADAAGDVIVLPARILAEHGDETKVLWSLAVTAPAFKAQRRRHVRVEAEGVVELRSPAGGEDDAEAEAVLGNLVDVSEGAIHCTVEVGSADGFLTASNQVIAGFRLGSTDFAVPGRAEFLRSTARPSELEALVVLFDEPVPDLDALRKEIDALEQAVPEDAAPEDAAPEDAVPAEADGAS